MPKTVSDMTAEQLTELIDDRVERRIEELLGDPDADLNLREPVRQRLLKQRRRVAQGERGRPLAEVMAELELD